MKDDLSDRTDVEMVKGIQFGLFSHHDIIKGAVCDVRTIDTYDGNVPKNNGLFDHNMGTIDESIICPVDQKRSKVCPGYFGKTDFALPVFNYNFMPYIEKLLKCVCFRCSALLINKYDPAIIKELEGKKGFNRFVAVTQLAMKSKKKQCLYNSACMVMQPTKYERISTAKMKDKDKDNIVKIKAEFSSSAFAAKDVQREQIFTPLICYNIFRKIKNEDVDFLGFNSSESRPEWMIITSLPIPPPNVRPSIRQSDNQRSEDDLSFGLSMIIKANKQLKALVEGNGKEKSINEYQGCLQYHVATYMNNEIPGVMGTRQRSSYRPLKAIAQRLKGKEGRMRGNIMGKRVDYSARAVISVDPNINIDEFGIAERIAMILTFPEIVTPYNIKSLQKAIRNGVKTYPGASSVNKRSTGISYNLKHADVQKVANELEMGDIVHRHLIDGDICLFNRQPTLHRMSMMGHKIKVLKGNTFRLNITDCDPYNADFDGDEMNVHCPQSQQTLEELRQLTLVPTQMISPGKSSPVLYLVQDTLLGGYLMTQSHVILRKNDIHNLLSFNDAYNGYLPEPAGQLHGESYWTGKQVFSMIIPDVTIMDLKAIKIKRGEIVDGYLDKKSLGDNSGGLVHQIYNTFGVVETTDFLNHSQNLVTRWITDHSFSISYKDCVIPAKDHKVIRDMVKKRIKEAHELIQKAQQGLYMPDLDDIYKAKKLELDIVSIVNKAGEEIKQYVVENIKDNAFFVEGPKGAGAQGKEEHFQQIIGCLGQQDFQGGRIPFGFTSRTLPHFHRYDLSPDSGGFARNSFGKGVGPSEMFFVAMSGRLSNISKSITTADSGYTSRKYIKATEDLKVNYDFTVRNAYNMIVQFSYGDDNYDPTKIEKMSIKMFEYNDDQMKHHYEYDPTMMSERSYWETFMTKQAIEEMMADPQYVDKLNGEYKQMMTDRNALRNVYFKNARLVSGAQCYTPVNLYRLIQSNLVKFNIQPYQLSDLSPIYVMEKYNAMLDSVLKYMPEKKNNVLVQQILFRSFLSSKRMIKEFRINKLMFDYLIEIVRHKIIDSFVQPGEMVGVIAAQTLGESSTQLTMNAFHTAGSASGSTITKGLPRLREIIQITKNLKQQTMHVYLTPEYSNSKDNAKKAMAKIAYTKLKDLLTHSEVIYNAGNTLTDDDEDREFMRSYKEFNALFGMEEENPASFSPWTLRLVFDKEAMMNRKITVHEVQEIIKESSHNDKDIECIFSDDNASEIVMRIRVKNDGKSEYYELMRDFEKSLVELKLRGIKNITSVDPDEGNIVKFDADGTAKDTKEWILVTGGSNMVDILCEDGVDSTRTITNDIVEFYEIFGIEAARSLLFHEFMAVYEDKTVPRHVKIMADVMTYRGKLMQIDRHGLNRNSEVGPIGKAAFEETTNVLVKAALFAEKDNMRGVSANIMMGQFAPCGTCSFDIIMDEEKLSEIATNGYELTPDFEEDDVNPDDVDATFTTTFVDHERDEEVDDADFSFGFGMEKTKEYKLERKVGAASRVTVFNNSGSPNAVAATEASSSSALAKVATESHQATEMGELNLGEVALEEHEAAVEETPLNEMTLEEHPVEEEKPASKSKSKSKSASKSKSKKAAEEVEEEEPIPAPAPEPIPDMSERLVKATVAIKKPATKKKVVVIKK